MPGRPGQVILPRPGAAREIPCRSIQAPAETTFTDAFGKLLPAAQYITTPFGKAAYYELLPISSNSWSPEPMVFVHGIQTPALGMLPLARTLHSAFPQTHCVLLDLWGHGLSETPIAPHANTLFHAEIDALLDHLGWTSAHFVSYSFGASATISYAAKQPECVSSMALIAPAGLIRSASFTEQQRKYLQGGDGIEEEAQAWILEFLEGGELVVPTDWKERVSRGEVVAEAVREWQMRTHPGHTASVVAMFRDGGVLDKHAEFADAAGTGIASFFVLGELDDVCSESDLSEVGFKDVATVPGAGHRVVREKAPEVANLVGAFWKELRL